MRIIVMGTGPFAVPSFEAIRQSEHEILAVVTKPEPPVKSRKGPPPAPVRSWANENELPVLDPPSVNDERAIEELGRLNADLLVVCDYGQILKPDALSTGRLGGINLHGSLLPAYRGAAPVQRALLSGDAETGVCVIHMTPKLDGGPILASVSTPIQADETSGSLEERLSQMGVPLVLESIAALDQWDGESIIGHPQDNSLATKAPRLHKREGLIDWNQTTRQIDIQVRGMQPWPIAHCEAKLRENKPPVRLAILSVSPVEDTTSDLASDQALPAADTLSPGQTLGGKELLVATGDGALQIQQLRPAGKKEMTGEEFQRGYQLPRGTDLSNSGGN